MYKCHKVLLQANWYPQQSELAKEDAFGFRDKLVVHVARMVTPAVGMML